MGGCRFCHNDKGLREQGWPHVSRAYACGDSLVGAGLVGSKMTSPIIFVGAGMASTNGACGCGDDCVYAGSLGA